MMILKFNRNLNKSVIKNKCNFIFIIFKLQSKLFSFQLDNNISLYDETPVTVQENDITLNKSL
jgi:hypothetical protein